MDGIDAALVRVSGPAAQPRVRLLAFETMQYPDWLRQKLLAIAGGGSTSAEEINQLHALLGAAFGEAALQVCSRGRVNPNRLFAIGSHGQTIHHNGGRPGGPGSQIEYEVVAVPAKRGRAIKKLIATPRAFSPAYELVKRFQAAKESQGEYSLFEVTGTPRELKLLIEGRVNSADLLSKFRGLPMKALKVRPALLLERPCTFQIAEPALIAELTGAPVVADFRVADMAAGGQGAPLVPMVDYLLLRDQREGTVALNIGGIANFTVIPPGAEPEQVFGFDTGPGNMIMDGLVRHFTKGQKSYDAGGRWAATGRVIEPLLDELLRLPFFAQNPPKSAGREQFGENFIDQFFLNRISSDSATRKRRLARQIVDRQSSIVNDLLRTATELTARTITDALERFVPGRIPIHRLIISGGGAHNRLLVARLTELLPSMRVCQSSEFGLDVDAKEAIAFAVLADRTMHGLPGNLPAVTGARRPVVLGKISRP